MPLVAEQHTKPTTLAGVIAQVISAFDEMGNITPIMVGKQYLKSFGVGGPARVLFVPETKGRIENPPEMGDAASIVHGCMVLVRAAEGGSDTDRFDRAYELGDLVIGCLRVAGTGRLAWNVFADGSPADVDTFGAELMFGFTFKRAVRHSAKRWALAAAAADPNTPQPRVPAAGGGTPAASGVVNTVAVTVDPVEPEEE